MVAVAERKLVAAGVLAAPHASASPGAHSNGGAGHAPACAGIDSISNVLTALFVASIGLIMSPVFLLHHAVVLLAGTAVVMAVKAVVVAVVDQLLGVPAPTAWAVGLTMAHTGEFSFVLLSMARQLRLLPETVRRPGLCAGVALEVPGVCGAAMLCCLPRPGRGGNPALRQARGPACGADRPGPWLGHHPGPCWPCARACLAHPANDPPRPPSFPALHVAVGHYRHVSADHANGDLTHSPHGGGRGAVPRRGNQPVALAVPVQRRRGRAAEWSRSAVLRQGAGRHERAGRRQAQRGQVRAGGPVGGGAGVGRSSRVHLLRGGKGRRAFSSGKGHRALTPCPHKIPHLPRSEAP
jgi:hypothetical protein